MSLLRLPGLIDIHVHLRDPGQTLKEDFYTGTCSALAGGVTAVFDMPNNQEPVYTQGLFRAKKEIAGKKAVCDWGLYFGSDGSNIDEFRKVQEYVVGLKLYLTLTTGKYLIEGENLEKVFRVWPKDKVIVVHGEGERIRMAIALCRLHSNKLHVTHISTKEDLTSVMAAKGKGLPVTCDVTPHHLFLTNEDAQKLNGFALVKPALAARDDQRFLWNHIEDIDCIASDHAPHTKEDKESDNPAYGVPGLETMLPLLLTAMKEGRLSQEDIIRMTNTNPQKIFGIKQSDGSYVEVDTDEKYLIENDQLKTKCGWSPFAGKKVYGKVKKVYVRGIKAFEDGIILISPGFGIRVQSYSTC